LLGVERRFRGSVQHLSSLGQICSSLAQHVIAVVGVGGGNTYHPGSHDGSSGSADSDAPAAGLANEWLVAVVADANSDLSRAANTLGALITRPTLRKRPGAY
jgi:hypothetical protein